jgi:hypothetical protein
VAVAALCVILVICGGIYYYFDWQLKLHNEMEDWQGRESERSNVVILKRSKNKDPMSLDTEAAGGAGGAAASTNPMFRMPRAVEVRDSILSFVDRVSMARRRENSKPPLPTAAATGASGEGGEGGDRDGDYNKKDMLGESDGERFVDI